MAAWRSVTSASKMVGAWVFVATRQWPELSGLMSMKQSVRSSSYSLNEGISPSRILQNTQSFMGPPQWGPRPGPQALQRSAHPGKSRGAPRHGSRLLDDDRPAVRIGCRRVLDPDDGVVQLLG